MMQGYVQRFKIRVSNEELTPHTSVVGPPFGSANPIVDLFARKQEI